MRSIDEPWDGLIKAEAAVDSPVLIEEVHSRVDDVVVTIGVVVMIGVERHLEVGSWP